jgi:hypothetical protein
MLARLFAQTLCNTGIGFPVAGELFTLFDTPRFNSEKLLDADLTNPGRLGGVGRRLSEVPALTPIPDRLYRFRPDGGKLLT